jgi:hypothetical protein
MAWGMNDTMKDLPPGSDPNATASARWRDEGVALRIPEALANRCYSESSVAITAR